MSLNVSNSSCQQASFGKTENDDDRKKQIRSSVNALYNSAVAVGLAADSYCNNSKGVYKKHQDDIKKLQEDIKKINSTSLSAESKAKVLKQCEAVAAKIDERSKAEISFFDRYINLFKGSERAQTEKHLESLKDHKLEIKGKVSEEVKQAVEKANAEIERLASLKGRNFGEKFAKIVKDNKWFSIAIAIPLVTYPILKAIKGQPQEK